MKSTAKDNVWCSITWRGTQTKASFLSFQNIHQSFTEIAQSTFTKDEAMTIEFINKKIKSNLRHAQERLKRSGGGNKYAAACDDDDGAALHE